MTDIRNPTDKRIVAYLRDCFKSSSKNQAKTIPAIRLSSVKSLDAVRLDNKQSKSCIINLAARGHPKTTIPEVEPLFNHLDLSTGG